eukprot:226609_1
MALSSSQTYNQYLEKNKCESLSTCTSLNKIVKYLEEYQTIAPVDIPKTFNKQNYPSLTDDFNHILFAHLGDDKPQKQIQNEYLQIHNYIMNKLKTCKVESCMKFQRNNRQRDTQRISLKNDDETDIELKSDTEYYIDTMDTIHCFFVHSYDVGYRVRTSELIDENEKKIDEEHDDDNEDNVENIELHEDKIMIRLKDIINIGRKRLENVRGRDVFNQSKFVTIVNTEANNDTKNDEKDNNKNDDEKNENNKSKIWELAQKKMKPFYNSQKE